MRNVNDTLKNNLVFLRKSHRLTQMDLAEKIQYSDKTISKWETGESVPNIETICKLAEFYDITIDQLVNSNIEDLKVQNVIGKKKRYNKMIITLLAISVIWIAATSSYIMNQLVDKNNWVTFIWAIPMSFIVAIIFNSIWGKRRMNYVLVSFLLWTLITAIFLEVLINWGEYHMYLLYILGAPIQIAIILWSGLKRNDSKAVKVKKEKKTVKTSSNTHEDEDDDITIEDLL